MSKEKDLMLSYMKAYFDKVQGAVEAGGTFKYFTGVVPLQGEHVIDAPTILGYTPATHEIYSLGIELRMVDPMSSPVVQVVDATAMLAYAIQTDGKVKIYNNHSSDVTYHARVTMPIKK